MKLLGDLMVSAHHRHRLGRLKADVGEQAAKVFGEVVLRLISIADLVMPQLASPCTRPCLHRRV